MRRTAVIASVVVSYTLMIGILVLIVLALTTAVADGWRLRATAALVVDSRPQFSPDGSQIAFIRAGEGAARLWVMSADGSDQRPLAQATRFGWARGGRALLFCRGGPRVFRVGADGGRPQAAGGRIGPPATRSLERAVFVRSNHVYLRDADGLEWELT
jgi:dipeptidyl aminopeptidase/acylaminoacyl peptidase